MRKQEPRVDVYLWHVGNPGAVGGKFRFSEHMPPYGVKWRMTKIKKSELQYWYDVQSEYNILQETISLIISKVLP